MGPNSAIFGGGHGPGWGPDIDPSLGGRPNLYGDDPNDMFPQPPGMPGIGGFSPPPNYGPGPGGFGGGGFGGGFGPPGGFM